MGKMLSPAPVIVFMSGISEDGVYDGDKAAETPSGLTGYVLVDEDWKDLEPELAPSRMFPDGGAFFLEDSNSTDALYGALWNISSSEFHSHKEVNALAISGFGEALLVNAGYNGAHNGFDKFSWSDINDNARQANMLLIDDANHDRKEGGTIVRGFTGPGLDYAVGDSGDVLHEGRHHRNFVYVDREGGAGGYWILFDRVFDAGGASVANIVLRPNSKEVQTVSLPENSNPQNDFHFQKTRSRCFLKKRL